LSVLTDDNNLRLRRINRIRTIQGSLAIEGNTLSEAQITAILEGKRVMAQPKDILEARNAINLSRTSRNQKKVKIRAAHLSRRRGS
jgi:Fic family protein